MSSTIKIDDLEPMEGGIVMHLLPFQIQHSGTANVQSFFKIEKTNLTFENQPVLEAAFRGRRMRGIGVTVPSDYTGVIFREEEGQRRSPQRIFKEDSDGEDENENMPTEARLWGVQSHFVNFTSWTRRPEPSHQDKVMKWLEFTKVANVIHSPVTKEAMDSPLKHIIVKQAPEDEKKEVSGPAADATTPSKKAKIEETKGGAEDKPVEFVESTPVKEMEQSKSTESSDNKRRSPRLSSRSPIDKEVNDEDIDDDIDTNRTKRSKRKQPDET